MIAHIASSNSLTRLVESLYLGFLRDDLLLQQAVASLGRLLGAEGGYLTIRQADQGVPLLRCLYGAVEDYELHASHDKDFCRVDPLFAVPSQPEASGRVWRGNDLALNSGPETAAFFGRLRKLGWWHMLSGVFCQTGDQIGYVRFLRSEAAGAFDDDAMRTLEQILPHLTTSHRMREAFSQVYASLEHVLFNGEEGGGVVYLDGEGHVVMMNDSARRIFAAMDGLSYRGGTIVAGAWRETADIERLVADAVACSQRPDMLPARNDISISRPSGHVAYRIQLVPVVVRNRFTEQNSIIAALHIVDGEANDLAGLNSSIQGYQLTAAEARLARLLVIGMPPKEVARQTGLSLHTIRTQQRGLYRKLGVSRHFDLLMKLTPNRSN